MKKCFFSFSETDRQFVTLLKGRVLSSRYMKLRFSISDLLKRWDTESPVVIRQAISKKIKGTSRTIVFVGDDTHDSYWVGEEVRMTLEAGKPVFAIEVPDRGWFSDDPEFLTDNNIKIEVWSEEKLQEIATKDVDNKNPTGREFSWSDFL